MLRIMYIMSLRKLKQSLWTWAPESWICFKATNYYTHDLSSTYILNLEITIMLGSATTFYLGLLCVNYFNSSNLL